MSRSDEPHAPDCLPTETDPIGATDNARSRKQYATFRYAAIVTLFLSCALALSLNIVDPDLWGHVKYGQELLADGELPEAATHTYSAVDYPWINHETFAEIAMALGYEHLGAVGLLTAKCVLGMIILSLMTLVARWHGVGPLVAWGLMLLVATNLTAFFPLRPQLLSFLCCAFMLVALDRAFSRWHRREIRFRWLWCMPPLFAVWANSHGGFVAGLGIFVAYLIGRSIEFVIANHRVAKEQQTPHWLRPVVHLAAIALTAGLATLANPYGFRLPLWLVSSLGRPRPEITEWAAPKPGDPVFFPFVILVIVAAVAMFRGRRRRDWTQIAILALVGWQAAMHLRHIAFFALLCGFWLPPYVALTLKRFGPRRSSDASDIILAPWIRRTAVVTLVAIFVVQGIALNRRLTHLPVYRDRYPVDTFAFMADHDITGRLVVSFNWAQYAIAAFSPDVTVQFDGRFRTCYPQEIVDAHFDFLLGTHGGRRYRSEKSGAIDGTRALGMCAPDLVLVDRKYENACAIMSSESERPDSSWVLIYQDGVGQLWGRKDRFDHPESRRYLPPEQRMISDFKPQGAVPWPALPPKTIGRFALDPQNQGTS